MAAAVARDLVVRTAFTRIAWVSVGQTPAIMELQRSLFNQLTGNTMPIEDGATAGTQLGTLQAACVGQRWLIVLDDVRGTMQHAAPRWRVLMHCCSFVTLRCGKRSTRRC